MVTLIVLESAKQDFSEIKSDFRKNVSQQRFEEFKENFRALFSQMKLHPEAGTPVIEATAIGMDVRQRLVEQTRVVYSFDKAKKIIYVRMFLHITRDFGAHLEARLLRP